MIVGELLELIGSFAPFENAEGFDNVGLLIGDSHEKITTVLLTLDMTAETLAEARELGANTIVTHHPVIFHPLKRLTTDMLAVQAVRSGMNVISAHTNLDRSILGVNVALAQKLALPDPIPLGTVSEERLDYGYGCLSMLPSGITATELAKHIKESLGCIAVRFNDTERLLSHIAVIGGSGGSMVGDAIAAGADCLITGDVKHDQFYSAAEKGIVLMDAGHYFTEAPVIDHLYEILSPHFGEDELRISASHRPPFITTI